MDAKIKILGEKPYLCHPLNLIMPSIKQNYAYNVLLNLSRVVYPLITAPYIARVLNPDGVGLFNFANTYAGYFAMFAMLGIPTYGIRETAGRRDDKKALSQLFSELFSISAIATLAVTALYIASIFFIGKLHENFAVFLLAGVLLYLAPFRTDWLFQGMEQFGYITLRTLIIRTISIICIFVFVRTKADLIIYVLLNVAGNVAGDVWNFSRLLRSGIRLRLTLHGLKKHLSPIFILFASAVAVSIYTVLDTVMLGFMRDYGETGFYTNAMHISKSLIIVVTSLSAVMMPRMSQYNAERDYGKINSLANKSFSAVSFLAVPIAFGVMCLAPTFVPLFFGEDFAGTIIPLQILAFLTIAIGMNNMLGMQILIPMNMDKAFLHATLAGATCNFLLNLILIPRFGATGASVASITSEVLIVIVMAAAIRRNTPIRVTGSLPDLFRSIAGVIPFFPIMHLLGRLLDGWPLVFAFTACGGAAYLLIQKLLGNASVRQVTDIVRQKIKFHE